MSNPTRPPVKPYPVVSSAPAQQAAKHTTARQNQAGPIAPPVYCPQPTPLVLQRKTRPGQQLPTGGAQRVPVAPPVYRPQPTPKVLQTKMAGGRQQLPGQPHRPPSAPPVYRPEQKRIVQPKAVAQHTTSNARGGNPNLQRGGSAMMAAGRGAGSQAIPEARRAAAAASPAQPPPRALPGKARPVIQRVWVNRKSVKMNVNQVEPDDQVIPLDQLSPQELEADQRLQNPVLRIQTFVRAANSRSEITIDPQQVAPGLMRTTVSGNNLSHIGIDNVNAMSNGGRARQHMTLVTIDPQRYQGQVSGNKGLTNPVTKSAELASMAGREQSSSGALINGGFFSTNNYYEPDLPANTALGPTRTRALSQGQPYDNLSSITEPSRVENFVSPKKPDFPAPLTLGPNLPTNYQDDYAVLHFRQDGIPRVTPYAEIRQQDEETRGRLVASTATAVTSGPILSRDGQQQFPESKLNDTRYQYGQLRGQAEGNNDIPCPPGALYHASDRNPRSAIIVPGESRQDGRVKLLYVAGRGQGGEGMTMPELALTTARLGHAPGDIGLNLDGGNSSLVGTKRSGENAFNYHAQAKDGRDSATMILFGQR